MPTSEPLEAAQRPFEFDAVANLQLLEPERHLATFRKSLRGKVDLSM